MVVDQKRLVAFKGIGVTIWICVVVELVRGRDMFVWRNFPNIIDGVKVFEPPVYNDIPGFY
jgi:hypothetical protein